MIEEIQVKKIENGYTVYVDGRTFYKPTDKLLLEFIAGWVVNMEDIRKKEQKGQKEE